LEDPYRLGRIHGLLAVSTENILVSAVFGEENRDWFDDGREYHKNNTVCEQRVRVAAESTRKRSGLVAGQVYSMFFDVSEVTDAAPISDEIKEIASEAGRHVPVADTTLVSRFPLIEVKGKNAAEATRIIARHLDEARAQGWVTTGQVSFFVDNWRNEYELTRGGEKTMMQFDMRPSLFTDSRMNLLMLTLHAADAKLEEAIQRFEMFESAKIAGLPDPVEFEKKVRKLTLRVGLAVAVIAAIVAIIVSRSFVIGALAALVGFLCGARWTQTQLRAEYKSRIDKISASHG
jgi:hypothetical protein